MPVIWTSIKFCHAINIRTFSIWNFSWPFLFYYQILTLTWAHSDCQATNFRLFQTERVCRWQFQIWRKWKKVIQTGRKHCGKSYEQFLLLTQCFQKACFPWASKGVIVWKWVNTLLTYSHFCFNPLPNNTILDWSKLKQMADDIFKWISNEK